jgi:hypothetical protein
MKRHTKCRTDMQREAHRVLLEVTRRLRARLRRKPNVAAALTTANSRLMAKAKPMLG